MRSLFFFQFLLFGLSSSLICFFFLQPSLLVCFLLGGLSQLFLSFPLSFGLRFRSGNLLLQLSNLLFGHLLLSQRLFFPLFLHLREVLLRTPQLRFQLFHLCLVLALLLRSLLLHSLLSDFFCLREFALLFLHQRLQFFNLALVLPLRLFQLLNLLFQHRFGLVFLLLLLLLLLLARFG